MDRILTEKEKLILENAKLRLDFHNLVSKARKVVDSSRPAGKSGNQVLLFANYVEDLKNLIANYDQNKLIEIEKVTAEQNVKKL